MALINLDSQSGTTLRLLQVSSSGRRVGGTTSPQYLMSHSVLTLGIPHINRGSSSSMGGLTEDEGAGNDGALFGALHYHGVNM